MSDTHDLDPALALAEGLVNSHMPSGEHVSVDSPRALARFLEAYDVPADQPPSSRELEEMRVLQARLRGVFEASDLEESAGILNRILEESGAHPRLDRHPTGWHIEHVPARASLSQSLAARMAMALATVVAEDGFDRLRVCEGDTCRDVFVDRSRNRSRRFCSPQVCGNRAAVAAWRARQRAATKRKPS